MHFSHSRVIEIFKNVYSNLDPEEWSEEVKTCRNFKILIFFNFEKFSYDQMATKLLNIWPFTYNNENVPNCINSLPK